MLRLKKVAAHAFTYNHKGGNPVTVFLSQGRVSAERRCLLAKTCEWESVIVCFSDHDVNMNSNDNFSTLASTKHAKPRFFFYMPSGEEVSFCAHAAIGASIVVADEIGLRGSSSIENTDDRCGKLEFYAGENTTLDTIVQSTFNGMDAELEMSSSFEEDVDVDTACVTSLLNEIGLNEDDLYDDSSSKYPFGYPTFINSSVARHKTLVAMKSLATLNAAKNPVNSDHFKLLCDKINTTGLYLYSTVTNDNNSLECRQFPRASGYPEDPATGIAAAALAVSLRNRNLCSSSLNIFQGTAMGRRSRIGIRFEKVLNETKNLKEEKLFCSGTVSILSKCEVEVR